MQSVRTIGLALFLVAAPVLAGARAAGSVETIPTRSGATLSFLEINRSGQTAVILLPGGGGTLRLRSGRPRLGNFLVRSRSLFAAQGFRVVVPDAPSDRRNLNHWRTSGAHVADLVALARYLRRTGARRVWLVGTSRGSISAAAAAARGGFNGLVLTSSVTRRAGRRPAIVQDARLGAIRGPVLIVYHRNDDCRFTPASDAAALKAALRRARPVAVMLFDGGRPPLSRLCGAFAAHGYYGIEPRVVTAIGRWIRTH